MRSSDYGHRGLFHVLDIANIAAINDDDIVLLYLWGYAQECGVVGSHDKSIPSFLKGLLRCILASSIPCILSSKCCALLS